MNFFTLSTILIAVSSAVKYDGKSAADARRILNNSQGVKPRDYNAEGHPRGHALGWDSSAGSINSLQDYSRHNKKTPIKTGFQSIWDQDELVHRALSHPKCQNSIKILNDTLSKRETCDVSDIELGTTLMIQEWNDGKSTRCGYMRQMTLVLGHFQGQKNNADYES